MCSAIPHIPPYAFMEWTEKASNLPPKIREDFKDDGCTKRMYDICIRNTILQPPALPGPKTHLQSRSKCDYLYSTQGRQCTYNLTLWCVRVTTIAVKKQ
jgi:hypothetical protein